MNSRRVLELLLLFVATPLLLTLFAPRLALPVLVAGALACGIRLRRDSQFERRRLWSRPGPRPVLARIALRTLLGCAVLTAGVLWLAPQAWLTLPRTHPRLWLIIMVAYPVLSVYPQELVYRAYFMHRYAPLFRDRRVHMLAGAAAFGFAHLVFGNVLSVVLTFVGGFLFARTYEQTRSLLAAAAEHAVYGCVIFTIGLGSYFYRGPQPVRNPPASLTPAPAAPRLMYAARPVAPATADGQPSLDLLTDDRNRRSSP